MDSKVIDATVSKNTKPGVARSIEIACKRLSWKALQVLEKALNDDTIEMKHRIDAAKEVLNRAWGRPKQSIEANVNVQTGESLIEAITAAKSRAETAAQLPPPVVEKTIN